MALLKEIKDSYNQTTSTLSSLIRTINIGLVGVIWTLSNEDKRIIIDNSFLKIAILFVILSLFFDILQYLWKSILIRIALTKAECKDNNRKKNRNHRTTAKGKEIEYTDYKYIKGTKLGTNIFWVIKIIFCIIASILVIIFVCLSIKNQYSM